MKTTFTRENAALERRSERMREKPAVAGLQLYIQYSLSDKLRSEQVLQIKMDEKKVSTINFSDKK